MISWGCLEVMVSGPSLRVTWRGDRRTRFQILVHAWHPSQEWGLLVPHVGMAPGLWRGRRSWGLALARLSGSCRLGRPD